MTSSTMANNSGIAAFRANAVCVGACTLDCDRSKPAQSTTALILRADVPALQTYSFVVTDNDAELATREALLIAAKFWENHAVMRVPLVSLNEMARLASAHTKGTMALVLP